MPKNPVAVMSLVSTPLADKVAEHYGVELRHVLTGFKWIGDQIANLEAAGEVDRFIFGFEESYGYLSGTYVRDKDAVDAAFLICEMFAWYKGQGIGLLERLEALYAEFGYCLNTLHSYAFEGSAGFDRMQAIMAAFRAGVDALGGRKVEKLLDYAPGLDGLPKSDVLKFVTDGASVVVRPSGTEPKLKVYASIVAPDRAAAEAAEKALMADVERVMDI